jgi:hypothetical protein
MVRYALRNVVFFPLIPSYDRCYARYSPNIFIRNAVNVCSLITDELRNRAASMLVSLAAIILKVQKCGGL